MKIEYIPASEFCESVRDGTHDTPKQVDYGFKLVTSKCIRNGIIDVNEAYYISENDYNKICERSKVEQWDVLMGMIGNGLGRTAVVNRDADYAIKNLALFKIGNETKAKWLHYYLSSPMGQGAVFNALQGSGQPFISLRILRNFPVPKADDKKMAKVVSVLSAYDDIIEKNQKQIKLLEEAAQRLYKEWFVDLRFPGHENVKIIDGVPEGWRISMLGELCTVKKETVSSNSIDDKIPYIGLEHMPRYDFCLSVWGKASEVSSNKFVYRENDIIFGKIRPYFHKVGYALNDGVVSTDSFVLKPNKGFWGIVLMHVFDKAFVNYTYQTCKEGTKMPRADWKQMQKYLITIPDDSIRNLFEKYIWILTRKIKNLALSNILLQEARDRLLPKLMSGEIEV